MMLPRSFLACTVLATAVVTFSAVPVSADRVDMADSSSLNNAKDNSTTLYEEDGMIATEEVS